MLLGLDLDLLEFRFLILTFQSSPVSSSSPRQIQREVFAAPVRLQSVSKSNRRADESFLGRRSNAKDGRFSALTNRSEKSNHHPLGILLTYLMTLMGCIHMDRGFEKEEVTDNAQKMHFTLPQRNELFDRLGKGRETQVIVIPRCRK
jgi:hypothetical protein